ncbi:uncharacterized protein LOC142318947 isoform X4 [Lycorma delicatula]|uniref:uncharacterized protein LOC142318947 isoform X4 n=1 Tax=Lycorma delicatula TaxID=130591 RepID=UPI003F516676
MNVLCLKLRARKTWAPPPAAPKVMCNAPRHLITQCLWREKQEKMTPPLQITEDTPPDMLAGSMDLCVMLPSGHTVKMSVKRSTPMMDLLVQVTTANKISPAGHMIQALGERGVMPYKPSTPIGALDTWTIHIVPKNQSGQTANRKAPLKPVNQPFEQTFRLQVHLPRNQLYVTRISPKTKLSDILTQVCSEKNLDSSKYSLRHPVNLDQVLNLSCCLADYKLQEVALVSNRSRPLGVSSVDIMSLQQTDNATYNFSMSRNNRSKCEQQQSSSQGSQATVICHSRNSSDSSGYHEASVLSESPESNSLPDSLPRRSKLPSANVAEPTSAKVASNLSRSLSNLNAVENNAVPSMKSHSISSTSLVSITGRKKKAAPLPPPLQSKMSSLSEETPKQRTPSVSSTASSSATLEEIEPNLLRKSSTLPASIRVAQSSSNPDSVVPNLHQSNSVVDDTPSSSLDRLHDTTPVEHPKPKPRTVFRTESVSSDSSTTLGGGSDTTKSSVNTTLPRKSRKSYPAPAPKPRNIISSERNKVTSTDKSCTNSYSSRTQVISDSDNNEKHIETNIVKTVNDITSKRRICRLGSVDTAISVNRVSETLPTDDQLSITSSTSSVFIKTELPENKTSLKEFQSDTGYVNKGEISRERNFSVGNLKDVPAFLSKSPQLGRWKNVECLAEACPNACGNGHNSESGVEVEEEQKQVDNSELRLDDDEIDRIFHNATRDHTSLESGVGEEPPLSLLSLPSPPSSLTNQPESSTNNNTDNLDWEYKLPAPPTFRDETNSPTVTEFDTVTIGNLTEVFGPESILQTENKKQVFNDETNSKTVINEKEKPSGNVSETLGKIVEEKSELVISKTTDKSKEKYNNKVELLNDYSVKKSSDRKKLITESSKPDLLKRSDINEEQQTAAVDFEKTAVMNELSTVITERLSRPEVTVNDIENSVKTRNNLVDVKQASTLNNFVITTYKETKPVEVFEDDSIKSSNGERRDSSRDEAMFRAPKSIPRRFEPNLTRRSSFNSDDKPVNITVKRSVSHVSLLAGNVSRGPYRSHLARSNGALTETSQLQQENESVGSRLRKTASEVNISQENGDSKISDWRADDTVGLQSLQVLRSILPQLSHSQGCVDSVGTSENEVKQERVTSVSTKKFERTLSENKEEISSKEFPSNKRYSYSGPPTINLSTWSERPKRQVSIKMDRDYCSGFGKLKSNSLDETETKDFTKSNEMTNNSYSMSLVKNSRLDEKPDIIKSSTDLSRVPIVRAVELKKPYLTNTMDATDFNRCGFFNGRSYENLNCIENETRSLRKFHEPVLQSASLSSLKSAVSVSPKPSSSSSSSTNIKLNSQPPNEESFSSVTSLAKRFGQAKPRPSSCYLYGTTEKQAEKNEDNCIRSGNTSRVFLNASDKKFTSIVGINGIESNNNNSSNNINNNKTEIKIVQKTQPQTSRITIGGKSSDNSHKTVGFKINGNIYNKVESSSSSDVRAQSKISSGGYLEDSVKAACFGNKVNHPPSLRQNNTVMPVVKGFRKTENRNVTNEQSTSGLGGGINPPPPPVMPVLKPVGERKQIKTLPSPQVDPRDQLLASIRNFGGMNSLRKVASK